ncbi:MAG TPA: NAD(P)H-dependent glycerol-3-phosphate dehydrogenase [Vicinamibacteria bacterium]|nr:NAD(P)H-dependent glycerol-3-phosphate dehydrogenase [Vicinamibacteria bacterium]
MRISVIGAGSWGTALARLAALQDHPVRLWAYETEVIESIRVRRVNELFLPDIELPSSLFVTNDLAETTRSAEILLIAVPSQHVREVLVKVAPHVPPDALLVSATKGIEEETLLRMSEVIEQVMRPNGESRVVVLSGPTFAREVASDQPTALVAASHRRELARRVQEELSSLTFRIYTNDDVIGVELGGALKNVIAIAAGVCAGLGLGHNPVAALITRGLAELSRLSVALGGRRKTLAGLAGMGDLVLTCTGQLSRNRTVGVELGKGKPLAAILSSMRMVAEGVPTTHAALALARRHGVEMPITFQMHRLLNGETTPAEAIRKLMSRPLKGE